MPTTELHHTDASSLLARLSDEGRRVAMAFFSPPYSLKAGRYGAATASSYPNEPVPWAAFTADLMRRAAAVTDGVVLAVVDSSLDRKGRYRAAVERLIVNLENIPSVRLLRRMVWSKNGAPGSTYWPSHCFEDIVACCRDDVERPYYTWEANAMPARFDSGPGRQRNADGSRRAPAKQGVRKGSLARPGDVIRCTVGGGHQGLVDASSGKIDREDDRLATSGEAPFPWKLANWLVRGFSKPGDTVLDFCAGTGTSALAAVMNDRNFIGGDVRRSQIDIAVRRLARIGITPEVFHGTQERDAG